MQSISSFTGSLEQDAKGLWVRLKPACSSQELDKLGQIYSAFIATPGHQESYLRRTPGASFNPLPARLCHILLQEMNETNFEVLEAAFLVALHEQTGTTTSHSIAHEALTILCEITANGLENSSPPAQRIILTRLLDKVRHLHQWQDNQLAFQQFKIIEQTMNGRFFPTNERLVMMLVSALSRFARSQKQQEE